MRGAGVPDEMGWVRIFPFTCQSGVNAHKGQSCLSCAYMCVSALQENWVSSKGSVEEDVNLSPLIPLELVREDGRERGDIRLRDCLVTVPFDQQENKRWTPGKL